MGITHHNRLSLSQTYDVVAGGTVLGVTGISQLSGTVKISGKLNVSTAIAGVRTIATGGSGVVSSTRVTANSVILLSPAVNTGVARPNAFEKFSQRSAGVSFKVLLQASGGTAITGRVYWQILN